MVIRLGRYYGFRTINVVRRREQAEELLRLGGDAAVATNEEDMAERVKTLTDGGGVPFALDAVAGETGAAVVPLLGRHGRMLVYGALSMKPIPLDPRALLFNERCVEGFWLSEWVRDRSVWTMLGLFRRLSKLIRRGILATEIGPTFPLTDVRAACREAEQSGRRGKVLLRFG
jgi:NADPH:quinone reductase-like Zn-dependent oxidoreductase